MKNQVMKNVVVCMVIMVMVCVSAVSFVGAPTVDEFPMVETNDIAKRALTVSEGYEFIRYEEITEDQVIYLVEDNEHNQFIIAYTENEAGEPSSSIRYYVEK